MPFASDEERKLIVPAPPWSAPESLTVVRSRWCPGRLLIAKDSQSFRVPRAKGGGNSLIRSGKGVDPPPSASAQIRPAPFRHETLSPGIVQPSP